MRTLAHAELMSVVGNLALHWTMSIHLFRCVVTYQVTVFGRNRPTFDGLSFFFVLSPRAWVGDTDAYEPCHMSMGGREITLFADFMPACMK